VRKRNRQANSSAASRSKKPLNARPPALALGRLARHQGLSQREVLERMIVAADDGILATLNVDEPGD
jgi:hypothetical protein